ncbi:FU domain-containing protein T48 isoform X4 [Rhodnius prolixus]|uniref:FU domain-containing protein T48 isoform X4 n=1 Tax=Rhodnius prolixus TaxID=13249 RepID=UPI003D187A23
MKMGKPSRVCPLYYCLPALFLLLIEYALSLEMLDDCRGLVSCLKCDGSNTTQCTKCSQLVLRSRECSFLSCPPGYTSKKTNLMDYMTTICQERLRTKGLSGEVVGASAGIILCVLTALAFGLYCKYIRRSSKRPPSLSHSTQGSEESERECMEYLKEIRELRTEAPVFLDMLNETRKQVRTLPSYALQPYKPVLKDLSRILILLNKPDSKLTIPPPDWETLLAWAHRILGRYKKHHNNQVTELVSFFRGESSQYSGSGFDSNYNTRKRSDEYIEWHNTSQLDDFISLGFRPQDEITTEL